jgi:hypothetical protein
LNIVASDCLGNFYIFGVLNFCHDSIGIAAVVRIMGKGKKRFDQAGIGIIVFGSQD